MRIINSLLKLKHFFLVENKSICFCVTAQKKKKNSNNRILENKEISLIDSNEMKKNSV